MDRVKTSNLDNYNKYKKIIAENIEYGMLKEKYSNEAMLHEIFELMVDAVNTTKNTIRVCGEDKPAELVKSVFLRLNFSHIEYVINSINNSTTKIKNIEAYVLTALYKAPKTINSYYQNQVNADMASGLV
ncbi:MAG: DUF6017 domain-containing protein [Alkaliphilus sp.]